MRRSATTASNSFIFTDASGADHLVRWSLVPSMTPVFVPVEDLTKRRPGRSGAGHRRARGQGGPQHWTLVVTVANPRRSGRRTPARRGPTTVGRSRSGPLRFRRPSAEPDGPCRDINFDPTVLPSGIRTSDDPFPAAPVGRLCCVLRPAHGGGQGLSPDRNGGRAMTGVSHRFRPSQRLLHWLMAVLHPCHAVHRGRHGVHDRAGLSDARVDPQAARHQHPRARAGAPGAAAALWRAAFAGRPARPDEARRVPVALRVLRPDAGHAADRLGDAVRGGRTRSSCSAG